jgi:hypothetical protein
MAPEPLRQSGVWSSQIAQQLRRRMIREIGKFDQGPGSGRRCRAKWQARPGAEISAEEFSSCDPPSCANRPNWPRTIDMGPRQERHDQPGQLFWADPSRVSNSGCSMSRSTSTSVVEGELERKSFLAIPAIPPGHHGSRHDVRLGAPDRYPRLVVIIRDPARPRPSFA